MVQRTQRQAIGHHVGTVLAVPAHVCCFETNGITAKGPIEATHGALVGVSAQDLLSEPGPPHATSGRRNRPTAPWLASHGARSGASGPISLPEASRRSQISRSRCTNGIAARCRAAAALATGGPKSLISMLTGSPASV